MKTKEVEQITGLSRQTLIWYEKEGLIHPERKENNYREYSEKDVQLLQIIKMLRNMDISIDDIRQFLEKHTSVEELLEEQKAHLKREQEQLKSTEETVHFYADTRAPILEGLQEMYEPRISWLGKEQPPEPFHIGVRPDRKRVKTDPDLPMSFHSSEGMSGADSTALYFFTCRHFAGHADMQLPQRIHSGEREISHAERFTGHAF